MEADKKNIILMFDEKYSSPVFVHIDKEKYKCIGKSDYEFHQVWKREWNNRSSY